MLRREVGRTVTTVWMDLPIPPSGLEKTQQMETAGSSYTSDDLCHHSTPRHIQEESILHIYARKNLKIPKGIVLLSWRDVAITGLTNSLPVSREIISI